MGYIRQITTKCVHHPGVEPVRAWPNGWVTSVVWNPTTYRTQWPNEPGGFVKLVNHEHILYQKSTYLERQTLTRTWNKILEKMPKNTIERWFGDVAGFIKHFGVSWSNRWWFDTSRTSQPAGLNHLAVLVVPWCKNYAPQNSHIPYQSHLWRWFSFSPAEIC